MSPSGTHSFVTVVPRSSETSGTRGWNKLSPNGVEGVPLRIVTKANGIRFLGKPPSHGSGLTGTGPYGGTGGMKTSESSFLVCKGEDNRNIRTVFQD